MKHILQVREHIGGETMAEKALARPSQSALATEIAHPQSCKNA